MTCKAYRAAYCGDKARAARIVVHVKFVCQCPRHRQSATEPWMQWLLDLGAPGAKHLYDPVDGMVAKGGLHQAIAKSSIGVDPCAPQQSVEQCFSGYIVANKKMQQYAEMANSYVKAYVV